jgi:hypothetical protein
VTKWDELESRPQDARVHAAHYSTGTTVTEALSSAERTDAVLSSKIFEMESEWRTQYEAVESSVKSAVADMIFSDLVQDTATELLRLEKLQQF